MPKVYIVMEGCYSDRSIEAVFTEDQENEANEYARLIGGDVEEFPLNIPVPDDPGLDFFIIKMRKDGSSYVGKEPRLKCNGEKCDSRVWLSTHKDIKWARKSHWVLYWRGYAKNQEHAVRSANEIRRQILAGQRPKGVDMGKN